MRARGPLLPGSVCGLSCLGPEHLQQFQKDLSPAADSAFSSGAWNDEKETIPNEEITPLITNPKGTCTNVQTNKQQTAPDLLNSSLFYT